MTDSLEFAMDDAGAVHAGQYPISLTTPCLLGEDREFYYRRLLRDSTRLFKTDHISIDVLQGLRNQQDVSSIQLDSIEALRGLLQNTENASGHLVYIIQQGYSWDQFSITLIAFQSLLSIHQVFAPFLDCLHSFGFKTSEDDEIWSGYRRSIRCEAQADQQGTSYEFCYAIRYVARNNRTSGSPWSLRQTAVYQQYSSRHNRSVWLLLQPSTEVRRRFADFQRHESSEGHPMLFHVTFLFSAAENWKDYINHIRKDLSDLDEKACFSRVGRKYDHDYKVTFSDSQRVQNIRERLLRTIVVLDASLEVANGCKTHCRALASSKVGLLSPYLTSELDAYSAELRSQRGAAAAILERSRGTLNLLLKILEYRNDENFTRSGLKLHKDVEMLRDIARHTSNENLTLTELSRQGRKDARSLKALSILGTLYLPATFVATIFSSNLVQLRSSGQPKEETHFVIAAEFWLFIVLTAPLMVLTLGYMMWLERR